MWSIEDMKTKNEGRMIVINLKQIQLLNLRYEQEFLDDFRECVDCLEKGR